MNQTRDDSAINFFVGSVLFPGRILRISKQDNEVILQVQKFQFVDRSIKFPMHFRALGRTTEIASIQISQISSKVIFIPFQKEFFQIRPPL